MVFDQDDLSNDGSGEIFKLLLWILNMIADPFNMLIWRP